MHTWFLRPCKVKARSILGPDNQISHAVTGGGGGGGGGKRLIAITKRVTTITKGVTTITKGVTTSRTQIEKGKREEPSGVQVKKRCISTIVYPKLNKNQYGLTFFLYKVGLNFAPCDLTLDFYPLKMFQAVLKVVAY